VRVTDSAGKGGHVGGYRVITTKNNFVIPTGTATGTATVKMQNQNGTTQSPVIQIGKVSPGIFPLNGLGLVASWVLPVISGTQQPLQPVWQVVAGSLAFPGI